MFDSGIITFYSVTNTATKGQKPTKTYTALLSVGYDLKTMGATRYAVALQNDRKLSHLVEIPDTYIFEQNNEVMAIIEPYAYTDDNVYTIYQYQHTLNDKRIKVCDISLEKLEALNAGQITRNSNNSI